MGKRRGGGTVLVGILKDKRDLAILRRKRWYRMPLARAPKRRFKYIAFYQPAAFGKFGKCIRYYARVEGTNICTRGELLPLERKDMRAGDMYYKIEISELCKLAAPIKNRRFPARRVSFGFTTLRRLLTSRNILELYDVSPTESIVALALLRARIPASGEYYVAGKFRGMKARYFLDFAIFCARGRIAIECDNDKAHGIVSQRERDRAKDKFLRNAGWAVLRFSERQLLNHLPNCMTRVKRAVLRLGGLASPKL